MFWFFDFFSFLSETHLSYLAWSWFFFWFWASADSKFFFFISFVYSTLVYFFDSFKIPFSCFPLSFSFRPFGRKCTYTTIALPSPQHKHKSVSQSVSALRSIPSTLQHEFYFSCVFLSSHTYPNSRRFEVSYSKFVCVLSIISIVLSTLYLDGRKGFF